MVHSYVKIDRSILNGRSYSGFSLIEVLVSIFLMSCILMCLNAMHIANTRATKTAYYFSVASAQLSTMTELLYSLNGVDHSKYFIVWNKQNKKVLPQGRGEISGVFPNFVLTLFWGKITNHPCSINKISLSGCIRLELKIPYEKTNSTYQRHYLNRAFNSNFSKHFTA